MKITVAHNGDLELIPKLAKYPIESIFTKMTSDIIGGGRSSLVLADINYTHLKKIIDLSHKYNIEFTYLLNSTCLSNYEITRKFNKKLTKFIDKLYNAGVDRVVIAIPYMLDLIKKQFPKLKVSISTFSMIDSLEKSKFWYNRGADRLILSPNINRAFDLIKEIRKTVNSELEIHANTSCIFQCPYAQFHSNALSHASCQNDKNKGFLIDYNVLSCALDRQTNPVEVIKSRWIRPEDVEIYEEIGIDVFKIADRSKSSDWILNATKAYSEKSYNGNLLDIIPMPMIKGTFPDELISNPGKWLLKPKHINIELLKLFNEGIITTAILDNTKLNGFITYFKENDCLKMSCGKDCNYCNSIAEKSLQFIDDVEGSKNTLDKIKNAMIDKKAFKPNFFLIYLILPLIKPIILKKINQR